MNRREILKLSALSAASAITPALAEAATPQATAAIHKYDIFELTLKGPAEGNPYLDVTLSVTFTLDHRSIKVDGFYDGDGTYKIRFMPDTEGRWHYTTSSAAPALHNQTGAFTCLSAA